MRVKDGSKELDIDALATVAEVELELNMLHKEQKVLADKRASTLRKLNLAKSAAGLRNKFSANIKETKDMLVGMANDLNRLLKKDDDLFAVRGKEDDMTSLRLKILLEIVEQRELDKSEAVVAQEKAVRRTLLKELITKKKLDKLADSELADLEKELDSL